MNGIIQKWLLIFFLITILIMLFFNSVEGGDWRQSEQGYEDLVSEIPCLFNCADSGTTIPRAHVFYNKAGLKDELEVTEPLRELNAVALSDKESIDELIDDITIWIPRIYYEQFLVSPACIIILETKINDQGRAEVRFGIAMECTYKSTLVKPVTI